MKKIFFILSIVLLFCLILFISLREEKNNIVNNDVNIVFTTDNNYKEYLKTTIYSLIKNKKTDTVYNINILCVDFDKNDLRIYDKFNTDNVHIKTIPLDLDDISYVGNYEINFHVTRADLYKFFMPEIFPDLNKILYLDVDILVLDDLSDLYNIDLKNKYIGAVYNSNSKEKYNCGVLLYNLKSWRSHNLTKKLIKAKNKDKERTLMTQNAFHNIITINKVYNLPYIYNVWAYANESAFKYYIKDTFDLDNTNIKTVDDYLKSAVILHYYIGIKPWDDYWKNFSDKYVNLWEKYNKERIKYENK